MNFQHTRPRPVRAALAASAVILLTGCTHVAARRDRVQSELQEHSRALTTAVVDLLGLETGPETALALRLAREDQRIEGLPLDPIPAESLADDRPAGALPRLKAERRLDRRLADIRELLARKENAEARLLEFGARHEQAQNRARARWARWMGGGSATLAAVVALFIFVPAALPILGRLLAWLAAKVPALAGALGVVGVRAFDAVVKGIERAKAPASGRAGLANERLTENLPGSDDLETSLSREMDASHKALVRARKAAFR